MGVLVDADDELEDSDGDSGCVAVDVSVPLCESVRDVLGLATWDTVCDHDKVKAWEAVDDAVGTSVADCVCDCVCDCVGVGADDSLCVRLGLADCVCDCVDEAVVVPVALCAWLADCVEEAVCVRVLLAVVLPVCVPEGETVAVLVRVCVIDGEAVGDADGNTGTRATPKNGKVPVGTMGAGVVPLVGRRYRPAEATKYKTKTDASNWPAMSEQVAAKGLSDAPVDAAVRRSEQEA